MRFLTTLVVAALHPRIASGWGPQSALRGRSLQEVPEFVQMNEATLGDKLSGFWIGQLVGNFMGLPFEFQYIDEPMPLLPAKYYDRQAARSDGLRVGAGGYGTIPQRLNELQGAYTDDDTDIEFVTLHAVGEHGLGITYPQIAEAWKTFVHVRIDGMDALWFANKKALELMQDGVLPPESGARAKNEFWWTIDPQLVNEIWSAFYPGMVEKAVEKAEWGAKITSSGWGTHPTIFYAALYSGAFVLSDVQRLYDIAVRYVPEWSPFAEGLKDVKEWRAANPSNWRATRAKIFAKYHRYPHTCGGDLWNCGLSAMINGLMGAMALLYGDGDFMETVGIAIAAGFDNDNQAATLAGFLGVLHGSSGIPHHLTHEIAGNNWSQPFNNVYVNERRPPLPRDNTITGIVADITAVTVEAILQNGGSVSDAEDGVKTFFVKVTGFDGPSALPAPGGENPDGGCCSRCGGLEPWCSPRSGHCYGWKRQDYYLSCCCTACGGSGFCSPNSGNCYSGKDKDYYRNCTAA